MWLNLYGRQAVRCRDGNSSDNFTPRGIEESRNGNLTFFEDRGRQNLFLGVLGEFRGALKLKAIYYYTLFDQPLFNSLYLSASLYYSM